MHNKAIIVQIILIIVGFSELIASDAYFTPYLLIFASSLVCLYSNSKRKFQLTSQMKWLVVVFSVLFASMIILANYKIWIKYETRNIISALISFFGVFFSFWQIFTWIILNHNKICLRIKTKEKNPILVFLILFALISAVNLSVLFLCKYPGNMSYDSNIQIGQIFSGSYSNHHPFWHTMAIRFCVGAGLRLFHYINAAVAFYSIMSILFMAFTFAFAVATLAEINIPYWVLTCISAYFVLMPYHILYSMTMWKDIPFGACVLLFSVFFFRIINQMSLKKINYIGFVISSFGICLFRSNGLFAFIFTALCFIIIFKSKHKKILFTMIAIIILSFVLKYPVLKSMNVTQPDLIEALSIPTQQIARTIVENKDLTDDQRELLENVVDVDRIESTYVSYISDPMKELVRAKGNQDYIIENSSKFIDLYFKLFFKHPGSFIRGWIDQTRGYWNSGYDYPIWYKIILENDFGIYRTVNSEKFDIFLNDYLSLFKDRQFLNIFISIGIFNWLVLFAIFVSIVRKDKLGIMVSVPVIMTVLSLLVTTPVFSEFRYVYATFCSLPFIMTIVLRPENIIQFKETNYG